MANKKVLLLGGTGFIGRGIQKYLGDEYDITAVSSKDFDLTLKKDCYALFTASRYYDVVINAVCFGRDDLSSTEYFESHWLPMIENIDSYIPFFKKYIHFGSGYEFGEKDLNNVHEYDIKSPAHNSYGMAKKLQSSYLRANHYCIRIFGCFDSIESNKRLLSQYQNKIDSNGFLHIKDRYFDYISLKDLCTIVRECIEGRLMYNDINAVYSYKLKLGKLLALYSELTGNKFHFIIDGYGLNYTGSSERLEEHKLALDGLEKGIIDYVNERKKNCNSYGMSGLYRISNS